MELAHRPQMRLIVVPDNVKRLKIGEYVSHAVASIIMEFPKATVNEKSYRLQILNERTVALLFDANPIVLLPHQLAELFDAAETRQKDDSEVSGAGLPKGSGVAPRSSNAAPHRR